MRPLPSPQPYQAPLPPSDSGSPNYGSGSPYPIWKRQTVIQPAVQPLQPLPPMPNTFAPTPIVPASPLPLSPLALAGTSTSPIPTTAVQIRSRIIAIVLICLLSGGLYFVWYSSPAATSSTTSTTSTSSITQQNFSSTSSGTTGGNSSGSSAGTIQVYVTGAVKHPGVYSLPQGARVHDLLRAAGGPLPQANLVALNLVAKLSDGQEVYVTVQGETPPSYVGGVPGPGAGSTGNANATPCVNINTATADDLRLNLHLSSTSAQTIINYRMQHGDYQSVQELSNVVSKTIYDKIKGTACVS